MQHEGHFGDLIKGYLASQAANLTQDGSSLAYEPCLRDIRDEPASRHPWRSRLQLVL